MRRKSIRALIAERVAYCAGFLTAAAWISWSLVGAWWSQTRPHHPDSASGFVHYVKTPIAVVYLSDADNLIQMGLECATVGLTLVTLIAGFVLKFDEWSND